LADIPRTHYLNADFDLSLRPRAPRVSRAKLNRQIQELSSQALLGASDGDAALVRAVIPDEFLDYLAACGIGVPRVLVHPHIDPGIPLEPFGWNAEAAALNQRFDRPQQHAALDVVCQVNSRRFAAELEQALGDGATAGTVVSGVDELESFLSYAPADSDWVFKAEHGNSALANRLLHAPGLSAADRRFVEGRFAEDDSGVVEPWLQRERDWCAVFDAPFVPARYRIHEAICTRDGALIGALFGECRFADPAWAAVLHETAVSAAAKLVEAGYSGPVCLDAFSWRDGKALRLRPFVDLNCRRSMSDGAYRLWQQSFSGRLLYYRFFSRRRLTLPDTFAELVAALGERRYDPSRRSGILLASPLEMGNEANRWRTSKLAVVIVGTDREAVFEMDDWFRERFVS
jgi:hypothetical protein